MAWRWRDPPTRDVPIMSAQEALEADAPTRAARGYCGLVGGADHA